MKERPRGSFMSMHWRPICGKNVGRTGEKCMSVAAINRQQRQHVQNYMRQVAKDKKAGGPEIDVQVDRGVRYLYSSSNYTIRADISLQTA